MSADLQETMKEICNILQQVHGLSFAHWRDETNIHEQDIGDAEVYKAYTRLIDVDPWVEPDKLDHMLRESKKRNKLNLLIQQGSFYLPPLDDDKDFVATLSIDCNLTSRKMNLRIEMHRLVDGSLCGIGYRLEFGAGEHAHFHSTLMTRRPDLQGGKFLSGCPNWLPTDIPRIPTMAKNPVSLVICAILSLYGKKALRTMLGNIEDVKRKYLIELKEILE